LAGIGDSISQGFSANSWPGDHPSYAFGQGTDSSVNSLYLRFKAKFPSFTKEFVSVSGAEMVGGSNNAAAQARRICAQASKPDRVVLELGGNDVCNRNTGSATDAASNLYSVTTYRNALKAALDVLGGCLASGAEVTVLSMPRVDFLYEAGNARNALLCNGVWSLAGVCRVVTGESDANRRRQLGARVDAYNDGIHAEVDAANTRYPGKVHFNNDWQGSLTTNPNTSVGSYKFGAADINTVDCFHPYKDTGQKKLACAAWEAGEYGNLSNISTTCLR
jgi:lysophospholipase L1-like esterase